MCGHVGGNPHMWWFWTKTLLIVILLHVAILTKRAVAILVVAVLVATGFVAILGVSILEWNQGLYL